MVQTLPAEDFSRTYSPNVVETFVQRIPGVTTNNVQGNEFATDLRYRGFAASPLQGTPQGLAVYMQGIRVNEAFGDASNRHMHRSKQHHYLPQGERVRRIGVLMN
jgi:iron complex outermembrane receptor protein